MKALKGRNHSIKEGLEALHRHTAIERRLEADPIYFPHLYKKPRDIEVSALLSSVLAYGRVSLFQPKIKYLLDGMGKSPADFVANLNLRSAGKLLRGFVYRFNVATDLAVLFFGMSNALQTYGSLENLFLQGWAQEPSVRHALNEFTLFLRGVEMAPLRKILGPERGINHLLPSSLGGGASKRLNLFLRWMVRGPDNVDFGIWKGIDPSALIIPLDTHIGRLARHLGCPSPLESQLYLSQLPFTTWENHKTFRQLLPFNSLFAVYIS